MRNQTLIQSTSKFGRPRASDRRRGFVVSVYTWIFLWMALFPVAALTYDMSRLYWEKGQAQRAADAASLAGGWCLNNPAKCTSDANSNALTYAAYNGYDTAKGATVTPYNGWEGNPGWFHVVVRRPEPLLFAKIFFWSGAYVSASSTAAYSSTTSDAISTDNYGIGQNASYNYSQFGPYGYYSDGDYNSTKYMDDTQANPGSLNPLYTGVGTPNPGINFQVSMPSLAAYQTANGSTQFQVQIYDPTTTANSPIDEIRSPYKTDSGYGTHGATDPEDTVTQFQLVEDLTGSPTDTGQHIVIATQSYGDDSTYANQWVTPTGFTVDMTQPGGNAANSLTANPDASFHVNVVTTDGSSENGFSLRAGPVYNPATIPNTAAGDTIWAKDYGDTPTTMGIAADTVLPVNLNASTKDIDITLGTITPSMVPQGATTGGTITVTKFDTDVGADGLYYAMEDSSGNVLYTYTDSSPGLNPGPSGSHVSLNTGNGVFSSDAIELPPDFTGGTLHAYYSAGATDTSEWSMSYSGNTDSGSSLKLVQ